MPLRTLHLQPVGLSTLSLHVVPLLRLRTEQRQGTGLALSRCPLRVNEAPGLNLRGATLEACSAKEADFAEADLRDALCPRTDFAGAKFHGTNMERADMREALNYVIDPRVNKVKGARFSLPEAVALLRGLDIVVE